MQNTSIISYFNEVGLLIFPFWTPHFVVWTPHFGWTPRLNYTVPSSRVILPEPMLLKTRQSHLIHLLRSSLVTLTKELCWTLFFNLDMQAVNAESLCLSQQHQHRHRWLRWFLYVNSWTGVTQTRSNGGW